MAADPLLNRPFGAFEPDRLLSRPTDERPQKPQWDQKRKAASSHRRTQVSGTKTVVIGACAPIHPRGGPAGCPHPWRTVVFANRFRNLFVPAYVRAYAVSSMRTVVQPKKR